METRATLKGIDTTVAAPYSVERAMRESSPTSETSSHSRTERTEDTEATPPSTPGAQEPLHILFLGSSLGNFTRGEDAAFLKSLPLRPGSGDTLLLGLDHGCDAQKIEAAYNDSKGITRNFIMNGLTCAGRALGDEKFFDQNKWEYVGRYNVELRKLVLLTLAELLPAAYVMMTHDADALFLMQAVTRRTTDQRATRLLSTRKQTHTFPLPRMS